MKVQPSIECRIDRIRSLLEAKPRNVRLMAQLAVLLHSQHEQQQRPRPRHQRESFSALGRVQQLPSGVDLLCVGQGTNGIALRKASAVEPNDKSDDITQSERGEGNTNNNAEGACEEEGEAWALARRAVGMRPDLPHGHWALSVLAETLEERMVHLRAALERTDDSSVDMEIPKILGLARLLLEPRQEEKVRYQHCQQRKQQRNGGSSCRSPAVSSSSNTTEDAPTGLEEASTVEPSGGSGWWNDHQHPSRRPLTHSEEIIYQAFCSRLDRLDRRRNQSCRNHHGPHQDNPRLQDLAAREYAIGMMFRKMATLPTATTETTATLTEKACGSPQPLDELRILYRKRCVRHLASSHRRFHPDNPAIMLAAFWLSAVWGDGPKGDGGLDNNRDGPDDENDSSVIAPASPVLRCPPAYVVGLYSTFASRFDALLVDKLRYQTPQLLRDLVDQVLSGGGKSRTFLTGLDLGCGTGLSGLAFRGRVLDWLRGVDLSPEMLDHARNRRLCYDELLVGDVTSSASYGMDNNGDPATALPSSSSQCTPATWDLIYACDVLVYLGDLEPVFALVAAHLTPVSGVFAFSTELLRESDDGDQGASPAASITDNPSSKTRDYRLLPTGRFAHSIPYLRGLAARLGLKVLATKVSPLRKDRGRDVLGCLAVLEKKASRRLPPT